MNAFRSRLRMHLAALLVALLTAGVLLTVGVLSLATYRTHLITLARAETLAAVHPRVYALTGAIDEQLSVVWALRAFTVVDPSPARLDAEFQAFVSDLYASLPGIRNVSLAPGGVQGYVYPLEGNEGVLGHDLTTDARSEVRMDVARAIETGALTLSGPYELRQGGLGLVTRLAVTVDGEFWGLVAAVLDVPPLLDGAGLSPLADGVTYALVDSDGRVFMGDEAVLLQAPVTALVTLPEGTWTLAAVPVGGWAAAVREPMLVACLVGFSLAGLVSVLVYLLVGREGRIMAVASGLAHDLASLHRRYQQHVDRDDAGWNALTQIANKDALRISLIYLMLGALWIVLSDRVLGVLGLDVVAVAQFQTLKGWLFVMVTAWLLYFSVRRRLALVHQSMTLAVTNEEKYRLIAENTLDVIWQVGLDLEIAYVNSAVENLLGYTPDELVEMSVAECAPDEDLAHMKSVIDTALALQNYHGGIQLECNLCHRDGRLIPVEIRGSIIVDAAGKPMGMQGLAHDMRERYEAERERGMLLAKIQEQVLLVERIIDTVPDGVLLLDDVRRPTLVNPAAAHFLDLMAEYDTQEPAALTHLGGRPLAELLTLPPDGVCHEVETEGRVFEVVARPLAAHSLANGSPLDQWVLLLHDATTDREVRARVEAQDRLSSLGQMAAGIAHDFNNILAVVILYIQMALRAPELGSATRERLQVVFDQAQSATSLVQQILDFGRRTSMEFQEIDLAVLLTEELELLQRTLPESIVVTLVQGHHPCFVKADPRRLQQAIMNLAVNARDAMPGGGELRLAVSALQVDGRTPVPLPDLSVGRWVMLTIEDTGEGIPEAIMPRIFEPFFTTKGPGKGSGLGLAQVYGIVQQHGGQIGVTSDIGKGARFTVCLPAVEVSATGDALADLATAPRGRGELILLVEDHAATRVALVDSLELLNFRVVTAMHGGEALALLDDEGDNIAIVLSDYVMPEVDGRELFRALKARGLPVPMVIVTGHPMTAELDDMLAEGLSGWLPKPPDLARLAHLLARALGR